MSTSPFASAALQLRDAEIDVGAWSHLQATQSPLYVPAAHDEARERLRLLLCDLLDAVRARLDQLNPPAPVAQGDPPPPLAERPVPKILSQSVHG